MIIITANSIMINPMISLSRCASVPLARHGPELGCGSSDDFHQEARVEAGGAQGFPAIWGVPFLGGPYNMDPTIQGTISGSPMKVQLPYLSQGCRFCWLPCFVILGSALAAGLMGLRPRV